MNKFVILIVVFFALQIFADESKEEKVISPTYKPLGKTQTVLFYEPFDEGWEKKWIQSTDEKFSGKWETQKSEEPEGIVGDKALTIPEAAKHYAISAKFPKAVQSTDKDLVVQYEVRLQNGLDCGGAYLKLLADPFEPENFFDKTQYIIMFGPDKCGSDSKVHFIFQYQDPVTGQFEEKHMTQRPQIKQDKLSHLYTLHVQKNNSFAIYIDQELVREGSLLEDFQPPVNPPKEIDDPTDIKPADWVDEEEIPDPTAVKPDDWDVPEEIPDPDAVKPDDWNDEEDGEWEQPTIANPEYKGEWKAPLIANPEYKGEWKARQIPNPNYFEDLHPHNFKPIGGIGFELWTMSKGIQFDNILVSYNKDDADYIASKTWKVKFEEQKRIQKEKEAAAAKRDAGDYFNYQKLIDEFVAFAGKNPYVIAASVAVGVLVPIILCMILPSGKKVAPVAKDLKKEDTNEEPKSEDADNKEAEDTPKAKTVTKRKPPKDNNE